MKKILLVLVVLVTSLSYGQKMKVMEGSIKNLKGIKAFTLAFDYSNLQIPKADSEEAYLQEKMAMREKKENGAGVRFRESWFSDREERFHPKFIESFNKRGNVQVNEADSEYIMKIHTTKLYPGYNVGIVRHNAEIDAEVTVYEKANPTNILLKGTYKDVQGKGAMGYDFDSGYRISECYAKLAKNIAKNIIKKAK